LTRRYSLERAGVGLHEEAPAFCGRGRDRDRPGPLVDPALLGRLLFGTELILGRAFGVAILALGLAPAFRTMLIYNALIAAYLAYLGASGQNVGVLLWPAAALHAAVALGLFWTGRASRAPTR